MVLDMCQRNNILWRTNSSKGYNKQDCSFLCFVCLTGSFPTVPAQKYICCVTIAEKQRKGDELKTTEVRESERESRSAHRLIHSSSLFPPSIPLIPLLPFFLLPFLTSLLPLPRNCRLLSARMTTIAEAPTPNPNSAAAQPPHVLISGAGLAGLFLGILLERAGIPYEIYERAAEIKPLGM